MDDKLFNFAWAQTAGIIRGAGVSLRESDIDKDTFIDLVKLGDVDRAIKYLEDCANRRGPRLMDIINMFSH